MGDTVTPAISRSTNTGNLVKAALAFGSRAETTGRLGKEGKAPRYRRRGENGRGTAAQKRGRERSAMNPRVCVYT